MIMPTLSRTPIVKKESWFKSLDTRQSILHARKRDQIRSRTSISYICGA